MSDNHTPKVNEVIARGHWFLVDLIEVHPSMDDEECIEFSRDVIGVDESLFVEDYWRTGSTVQITFSL